MIQAYILLGSRFWVKEVAMMVMAEAARLACKKESGALAT